MATPGTGSQSGHSGRQRLRPWLIDQINSGEYPGLGWIDRATMTFKISWKHFGKPGVDEERDAKIFREWARHTGKYKMGDAPDPSTWKTRFRCALHKLNDIEELHSMNMLDGDDPYRVYRFKSKDEIEKESKNSAAISVDARSPAVSINDCYEGHNDELIFPSEVDELTNQLGNMIGINDTDNFLMEVSRSTLSNSSHTQEDAKIQGSGQLTFSSTVNLQVQLFFKAKEIGSPILIDNPSGCRIAYGAPPPLPDDLANENNAEVVSHIFGPFHAQQVYFPMSDDPDTNRLLQFMKRGLVLQTNNNDIYATRLCRSKIYFCSSQSDDAQPLELPREHTTKVFDYHGTFQPQLQLALTGSARPPRPELFFSFGQRWGGESSLTDNLVHACVTHVLADHQIKSFFDRKSEICYSNPNPLDLIATQIDALNLQ